jgi:hypothetical protein
MKPSHAANDNLNDRTRKIWQPRIGRDLTNEDVRQIAENVTGFFSILAEWSRAQMPPGANATGEPVPVHALRSPQGCQRRGVAGRSR